LNRVQRNPIMHCIKHHVFNIQRFAVPAQKKNSSGIKTWRCYILAQVFQCF
jgi:hypothetical protein